MSDPVDQRVTESTGNVFLDLGRRDAELLLFKAQLAGEISNAITRRGWTQRQAAQCLGVDQPRVSHLVRGRLSGFSTDSLIEFLKRLDMRMSVTIEDPVAEVDEKALVSV